MKTILNRIFTGTSRIIPLVTALLLCLQATVQAQITGMRVGSGATRIRIVLDMDEPAKYKAIRLRIKCSVRSMMPPLRIFL